MDAGSIPAASTIKAKTGLTSGLFLPFAGRKKERLPSLGAARMLVPAVGIELTTYRLQDGERRYFCMLIGIPLIL